MLNLRAHVRGKHLNLLDLRRGLPEGPRGPSASIYGIHRNLGIVIKPSTGWHGRSGPYYMLNCFLATPESVRLPILDASGVAERQPMYLTHSIG